MSVTDITGRVQSRKLLRLERVLRSFTIFFGADENEMNAGMFREARELLGHNPVPNLDRKYCDCAFGTCQGLDVERCVYRYVEDVERDNHERIAEHEGTIRELLDAREAAQYDNDEQARYDSVTVTGSGRQVDPVSTADQLDEDLDPKWETLRDMDREAEILARKCGLCGSSLVIAATFEDTGRPNRLRCSHTPCDTLYRVDYESPNWDIRIVEP